MNDHGILNTPLRQQIQVDCFASRQDRAKAHELLDAAEKPLIQQLADSKGVTFPAMHKHLRSECHWQPKLVIALLSQGERA